tara:strand:+ start:5711 stop:6361 length:651 start_codon:yes stop_codon:yes gene_type:complete
MKFLKPNNKIKFVSIFVVWLFHVCGVIGIGFSNKELFISFTPINLLISFFLLFSNQIQVNSNTIKTVCSIFLIGMIAEIIGVNYGYIFGEYTYLDNLGMKIMGVPLMIGIQWVILSFITGSFAHYFFNNKKFKSIILGVFLMILLDVLIEPVAPDLGFWIFESEVAPLQNYIGWLLIAIPAQIIFHFGVEKKEIAFSSNLLIVNFFFFGVLNLIAL